MIAEYIQFLNTKSYKGRCFCISFVKLLLESKDDFFRIKRSSTVAESYVNETISNKISFAIKFSCISTSTSEMHSILGS